MRYVVTKDEIYSTNNQNGGNKMKKMIIKSVCVALALALAVVGTYLYTMSHLEITTDGDGDCAFITSAGHEWFYGINGYPIDKDGTMCELIPSDEQESDELVIAPMSYELKTK